MNAVLGSLCAQPKQIRNYSRNKPAWCRTTSCNTHNHQRMGQNWCAGTPLCNQLHLLFPESMELRFFEVSVIWLARKSNVCVLTALDRCDERNRCKLNGSRRDAKLVLSVQYCISTLCESACSCWAWIWLELSSVLRTNI